MIHNREGLSASAADVAADTRERLLLAGEDLFAEQGFGRTSVRQIITRAGASNGAAVGYHFGSKEGLYALVIDRVLSPVIEAARDDLSEFSARPVPPAVGELCSAFVRPIVALCYSPRGETSARLLGLELRAAVSDDAESHDPELVRILDGYLALFIRSLPALSASEVTWRYRAMTTVVIAFVFGLLDDAAPDKNPARAVARLAAYCEAGFAAAEPAVATGR